MRARDPLRDPGPLLSRVYAYVAYRIGDGPDAQDVTSDVFERALRYRDSYDPAKSEPIAWLIGIARRCIADSVRPAAVPMSELPSEAAASDDLEDEAIRRVMLSKAVSRLDGHDQELIALRYGADLTARQIAAHMGVRTHAVEVALSRALERLRNALDQPRREIAPFALQRSVRV
jgi:RNA polymerase sigma-70 factor, ECF subfamily